MRAGATTAGTSARARVSTLASEASARTAAGAGGATGVVTAERRRRAGRPRGRRRGGAGALTTLSSICASSASSRRSKSFICSENASYEGSTHWQIHQSAGLGRLCLGACWTRAERLRRYAAGLAIVELVSQLDHLQAQGPWPEKSRGEDHKRFDDRRGADVAAEPRHPH